MQKLASDSPQSSFPRSEFHRYREGWITDGLIEGRSARTLGERRWVLGKFEWYLQQEELAEVDPWSVRQFLAYVTTAPDRWHQDGARVLKATSRLTFYRILRAWFNWLEVQLRGRFESPLRGVKPPKLPKEQVEPFTDGQVERLLETAKARDRDHAIVLFLWDTGCRASELCQLTVGEVDLIAKTLTVLGKGNKRRPLYIGVETAKALQRYLGGREAEDDEPLFPAERGKKPGAHLTVNGLGQIIRRLGKAAKVEGVRCSPHTFRHTFCVSFLRNGGNLFELQRLTGHEDLAMLRRYVALAQCDVAQAHRRNSPVDRRRRKK